MNIYRQFKENCYPLHILLLVGLLTTPQLTQAQENITSDSSSADPAIPFVSAGPTRRTLTDKQITFDAGNSKIPAEAQDVKYNWDFGDGIRTSGQQVSHAYTKSGSYLVKLTINTSTGQAEDTTEVRIFDRAMIILADNSASDEQLQLHEKQAAEEDLLLLPLKTKLGGPQAIIEEELTQALIGAREEVAAADLIVVWTSGGVGANVLSKFAQDIKQTDIFSFADLNIGSKGIIILADSSFGLLSPTVQNTFDRLQPSYAILTRSDALPLLYSAHTADEAREVILNSPIAYRLIGTFSSRAVDKIGITNFLSVGINYLVNNDIPINNITLVLMIPVIATILAFFRQVVGIKAFGLITPAMTTLSFLVLGLTTGLTVFIVVLLSGTMTRIVLKRLRMLYLPRMALVLTNASLAILILFGISAAFGRSTTQSFSIFPILILTILAEEFIAVQFSLGIQTALRTTAWTLLLTIVCYFVVSWDTFRTFLLAYPEAVLLAIPINIALGRFTGLRVVEYFRFRQLLRSA